mmetsp:Transcript_90613/g.261090  ORF Transcript_90613/g.261090 Transcript_90613/m.261090 type:complete len:207 (-) Transcript_90613:35-655(-)
MRPDSPREGRTDKQPGGVQQLRAITVPLHYAARLPQHGADTIGRFRHVEQRKNDIRAEAMARELHQARGVHQLLDQGGPLRHVAEHENLQDQLRRESVAGEALRLQQHMFDDPALLLRDCAGHDRHRDGGAVLVAAEVGVGGGEERAHELHRRQVGAVGLYQCAQCQMRITMSGPDGRRMRQAFCHERNLLHRQARQVVHERRALA